MELSEVSLLCKALSDQNRLRIVQLLTGGEQCGCELLEQMRITQPTLSHHMKILCDSNLVNARKEGKWMHYSLSKEGLSAFRDMIGIYVRCDCENGDNDAGSCCCG